MENKLMVAKVEGVVNGNKVVLKLCFRINWGALKNMDGIASLLENLIQLSLPDEKDLKTSNLY